MYVCIYRNDLNINSVLHFLVGIDAHCEYTFKDLEAVNSSHLTLNETIPSKPISSKTNVTDTFKERKRKNTSENDITQSKQKKKRDNALLEKLKTLQESFGKTSIELKKDLEKSATMSNKILQDLTQLEKPTEHTSSETEQAREHFSTCQLTANVSTIDPTHILRKNSTDSFRTEPIDINENQSSSKKYVNNFDEFIDDEKINNMINEIESEIFRVNKESNLPQVDHSHKKNLQNQQSSFAPTTESRVTKELDLPFVDFEFKTNAKNVQTSYIKTSSTKLATINNDEINQNYKTLANTKKKIQKKYKNNYNFIDLLDKTTKISDDEDDFVINNTSEFCNTIKTQVDKYLLQSKNISSDQPFADLFSVSEKKEDREEEIFKSKSIESEENFKNENISLNKGYQNNNAIQAKDNHKELRDFEENKTVLGGNREVLKHLIESNTFDNNHIATEADVVSNSYNKEKSSKSFNFLSQTALPLESKSHNDTEQNKVKVTLSFDNNNGTDVSTSHLVPNVLEMPIPILHLPSTTPRYHQKFPVISPNIHNQTIDEKFEISAEVKFGNMKQNGSEMALVNRSEPKNYTLTIPDSQTQIPSEVIANVEREVPGLGPFENPKSELFNHISETSQFRPQKTHQNNAMSSEGTIVNVKRKRSEIAPVETLKPEPYILPIPENTRISTQIIHQNNPINAEEIIMNINQRCQYKPRDTNPTTEFTPKRNENHHNFINKPKINNQNENTRNYSYSATKIDVATREHDTIIRKIEMNLNITETIAQRKREYNRDHNTIINKYNIMNNNIDIGPSNTENTHSVNYQIPDTVKKVEENKQAVIPINIYDARTNKIDKPQNYTTKKSKRQNYTTSPENKCIDFETFQTTRNNSDVMLYKSPQYEEICRKDESQYYTENPEIKSIDFTIAHTRDKNEIKKNIAEAFSKQNNKVTILTSPTVTSYTSDTESQKKQSNQKVSHTLSATLVDDESSSSTKCSQNKGKKMESIFQKYCAIMRFVIVFFFPYLKLYYLSYYL